MTTLSNSVHLIGRLGMDPKFFEFEGGKMKTTFSLATSDYYKDQKGDRVQETQWHNIVTWGKTARSLPIIFQKAKK